MFLELQQVKSISKIIPTNFHIFPTEFHCKLTEEISSSVSDSDTRTFGRFLSKKQRLLQANSQQQ